MKRIVSLFLLSLLPFLAIAQEESLQVNNDALIWRKVYEKGTDVETIAQNLRALGSFKDITVSGGMVTAEMSGVSLDYKSLGYKRMSLPIYVVNNKYSAFVTVQVREGRYRVTAERIKTLNSSYGESDIESFALKNGDLDAKFLDAPAKILSSTFDKLFSGLDKTNDDDDW